MILATKYSACYLQFRRPSAGVPPLPIPNREVKPCSADGTGVTPGRVGRRHIIEALRFDSKGFFVVPCTMYEVQSTKYKVWIRFLTQIVLLRDLSAMSLYMAPGTWYFVHCTWYLVHEVLFLVSEATWYIACPPQAGFSSILVHGTTSYNSCYFQLFFFRIIHNFLRGLKVFIKHEKNRIL